MGKNSKIGLTDHTFNPWWGCVKVIEFAVLQKRFPDIPKHRDVLEVGRHNLEKVDLISGGFPCTDITISGAVKHERKMLEGDESGLVYEFARIANELKPTWIFIENVSGVEQVFPELVKIFERWHLYDKKYKANIPGAYTRRERIFIVGHLRTIGRPGLFRFRDIPAAKYRSGGDKDTLPMCLPWDGGLTFERLGSCVIHNPQTYPPRVREGNGVSRQLDKLRYRAIGKSVVPQVAEFIGSMIMLANEIASQPPTD